MGGRVQHSFSEAVSALYGLDQGRLLVVVLRRREVGEVEAIEVSGKDERSAGSDAGFGDGCGGVGKGGIDGDISIVGQGVRDVEERLYR